MFTIGIRQIVAGFFLTIGALVCYAGFFSDWPTDGDKIFGLLNLLLGVLVLSSGSRK
jgi:hypothetical protein